MRKLAENEITLDIIPLLTDLKNSIEAAHAMNENPDQQSSEEEETDSLLQGKNQLHGRLTFSFY